VLPDNKGRIALKPAAVLRCSMASAIADWIRTEWCRWRKPAAVGSATLIISIHTIAAAVTESPAPHCRSTGRANALDVAGAQARQRHFDCVEPTAACRARSAKTVLHSVCNTLHHGAGTRVGRLS